MAICDDCFEEFLHPLVHESIEKNHRFSEKYGVFARWDWDYERSVITFSLQDKPTLEIEASIVGTTEGDSWEWAWANRNLDPHTKVDIAKVREFGEAKGFKKLTTPFLSADEYTGWEMTSVAVHVLESLGSYRFPTENGFCYLVYRKILEINETPQGELHGAMRGTVKAAPQVDLTEPTGEDWDALSDPQD